MILGLPWFIWGFVVLGLVVLFSNALWIWYWWTMAPVSGYFRAARTNSDLGIVALKSGRMRFYAMNYVAGIFTAVGLPLSWIQRSPDSHRFGAVNAKIFLDTWGIATDPKLQAAVKVVVLEWNETHEDEQIADYADLYDLIKAGRIDDPILMPAVCEVPLYEVERYLPHIGAGDLEGHIAERVAEETDDLKTGAWPGWMKALIAIEAVVVVIVCTVYLLGGSGGA
ncbi:MAG: hypothetical protein WC343_05635 [Bacilli bacterium]|jgi:hypothetical protein